jgi:lipid II:glycine glycyltransferase (peptidoglycan interpeptide bridge formation enzyme)
MGDMAEIRIARKDGVAIAAIITLLFKQTCYYKYMGYDLSKSKMGAISGLVWHTIQKDKERGALWLDYGRTDIENESLAIYKDRWNGIRTKLSYYRFPAPQQSEDSGDLKMNVAKAVFACLPDKMLQAAGEILYKHIG